MEILSPFSKQQILHSPKLQESAKNNFKFYENGRKFSKGVENTVGAISPFPTAFSRLVNADT